MSINISSMFSDGLEDIKKNPILVIPNLLVSVASTILSFVFMFLIILFAALVSSISEIVGIICLIAIVFVLYAVMFLVLSYLQAGLTGMSFEAVKNGTTELSSFFSYGNKYVLRVLAVTILIAFIAGIPIGLVYGLSIFVMAVSTTFGLILMLVSLLFVIIYAIVLSIYFYFVVYAIVIDDTPVIESLRKSVAIFNENKSDVLYFFGYMILIGICVGFVYFVLTLLSMIPLLGLIFMLFNFIFIVLISVVLFPYVTVVGTRMYLALTRKECCCSGDCSATENNEMIQNLKTDSEIDSEAEANFEAEIDSDEVDVNETSEIDEK